MSYPLIHWSWHRFSQGAFTRMHSRIGMKSMTLCLQRGRGNLISWHPRGANAQSKRRGIGAYHLLKEGRRQRAPKQRQDGSNLPQFTPNVRPSSPGQPTACIHSEGVARREEGERRPSQKHRPCDVSKQHSHHTSGNPWPGQETLDGTVQLYQATSLHAEGRAAARELQANEAVTGRGPL